MILRIMGLVILSFTSIAHSEGGTPPHPQFSLEADGREVAIQVDERNKHVCPLGFSATRAQPSSDGDALIVSDTEYIATKDLFSCDKVGPRRSSIPSTVGTLVDINIRKRVYLAIDPISTSPLSFLATVARVGTSRNLTTIPGSYVESLSLNQLQRYGFSYDESRARGRISLDGRYVSPNGEIDCGANAYPGVWDILKNRKVVAPKKVLEKGSEAVEEWCRTLFPSS